MTVPTARQVFGPARKLHDWWDADQTGKPLSPIMAHWLRRGPTNAPVTVQKALARRGLVGAPDWNAPRASRLTQEGAVLRALLGSVPRHLWPKHSKAWTQTAASEVWVTCAACGTLTSAELIAWGDGKDECIICAMKEEA